MKSLKHILFLVVFLLLQVGVLLPYLETVYRQKHISLYADKISPSSPLATASYERVIFLLIDSLRFDLLLPDKNAGKPYQNKIPVFLQTLQREPQNSVLYRLDSPPPDWTPAKVAEIVTGNHFFGQEVPSVNPDQIKEDNFVYQAHNHGKRINVYAGGVWKGAFSEQHDFFQDSEWINDTKMLEYEGPDALERDRVVSSLKSKNFELAIAHFMCLDHVTHTYGLELPMFAKAIENANQYVQDIMDNMDEKTILIALSDHGVSQLGQHGTGFYALEESAFMFGYTKKGFRVNSSPFLQQHISQYDPSFQRTIVQEDIAATMAMLLGTSLPYSNTGRPIQELLPRGFAGATDTDFLSHAIAIQFEVFDQIQKFVASWRSKYPEDLEDVPIDAYAARITASRARARVAVGDANALDVFAQVYAENDAVLKSVRADIHMYSKGNAVLIVLIVLQFAILAGGIFALFRYFPENTFALYRTFTLNADARKSPALALLGIAILTFNVFIFGAVITLARTCENIAAVLCAASVCLAVTILEIKDLVVTRDATSVETMLAAVRAIVLYAVQVVFLFAMNLFSGDAEIFSTVLRDWFVTTHAVGMYTPLVIIILVYIYTTFSLYRSRQGGTARYYLMFLYGLLLQDALLLAIYSWQVQMHLAQYLFVSQIVHHGIIIYYERKYKSALLPCAAKDLLNFLKTNLFLLLLLTSFANMNNVYLAYISFVIVCWILIHKANRIRALDHVVTPYTFAMAAWAFWTATQHTQQLQGLSVYAAYILTDDLTFHGPLEVFINTLAPLYMIMFFQPILRRLAALSQQREQVTLTAYLYASPQNLREGDTFVDNLKLLVLFYPYLIFKMIITTAYAYHSQDDAVTALRVQESSVVGWTIFVGIIAVAIFWQVVIYFRTRALDGKEASEEIAEDNAQKKLAEEHTGAKGSRGADLELA